MAAESLSPGAARCSSLHCCCCKTWVWILKYLSTNQKLGEEEGCHYPELLSNVTDQDMAPKEAAPTLPHIPEGSRHSTGSMVVSWPCCPCGPSHMPQSVPHLHSWWDLQTSLVPWHTSLRHFLLLRGDPGAASKGLRRGAAWCQHLSCPGGPAPCSPCLLGVPSVRLGYKEALGA